MTTHRLLTKNDVAAKIRISKRTIDRKVKDGSFPIPKRTGSQSVHWIESEIDEWIEALPDVDPNDWHSPNRK